MEKLTIGQVIEKMNLDEVAIKVTEEKDLGMIKGMKPSKGGLQYDTSDYNILKDLDGKRVIIVKSNKHEKDLYVIMKKSLYNRIANNNSVHDPVKENSDLEDEFDFQHHAEKTDFSYHAKRIGENTYEISWYSKLSGKMHSLEYKEHIVKVLIKKGTWVIK